MLKILSRSAALLFFGLLGLELLLQGSALGIRLWMKLHSQTPEREDLVILALGESTTQGGLSDSYPKDLEGELRARCPKAKLRVINEGVAGLTTDLISQKLPEYIAKQPFLLISMMGINDREYTPRWDERSSSTPWWRYTRTTRAVEWLYRWWTTPSRLREDSPAYSQQFAQPLLNSEGIENAVKEHEAVLRRNPRHHWARVELGFIERLRGNIARAESLHLSALRDDPRNGWFFWQWVLDLLAKADYERAESLMEERLRKFPGDGWISVLYRDALKNSGRAVPRFIARMAGKALPLPDMLPQTRENYRHIVGVALRQKIKVLAMPYPTRPLAPLKSALQGFDMEYFDSEPLFRKALGRYRYEELFYDRFAGDFGHLSALGNRLLASALADRLLPLLPCAKP